ncbi:MAG: acyl-CoA dehydrogenase family protein, partial [Calditrichia bacterium]|nr:acyl-CoA dehydrogenase family protein [Calditrichia bacterium]
MPNFFKDNDDILFHLKNLDLDKIIQLKENDFEEKDKIDYAPESIEDAKDSYEKILDIVGDIAGNIVEPNAAEVDEQGTRFENGEVTYAEGTQKSLKASRQAELIGFTLPRKYGGLNCPTSIYIMAIEIMSRADAAFMNIFGLQSDIANTIYKYADDETKDKYIARLCTEDITAAMTLTEPDAGSDLQAVMMKAHQDENGNWFLNGVKRFITNGNAEIHLVLARSEEGTTDGRGLSMFVYE